MQGVYGYECGGLLGELHGSHHEACRACGAVAQREGEVGQRRPCRQGHHSHAAVVGCGHHAQHAADHLRLVGRRSPPAARYHAVGGVKVLVVSQFHGGALHGAHADALLLAPRAAHLEGVEAVGCEAGERQGRHGGAHGVAVVGHLHHAGAERFEVQRQLCAAHMGDRRHGGAAAAYAHVVDEDPCGVGLEAAFHAECQPSSVAAVGRQVDEHLLPA